MFSRIALSGALTWSILCQAATVSITNAWIAEGPPSVPVNAGYMQIENNGQDLATLVAVESPLYARIEIHQSTLDNDVSGMTHIRNIGIAPGTRLTFAPGGLHLMIYNNGKPPAAGETISLLLHFADGTINRTEATVRKMSGNNHHDHATDDANTGVLSQWRVTYQYLLPQHFLSSLMYKLTRTEWPVLKNLLIRNFIRLYNVDMSLAVRPEAKSYRHFNEFFTRALKPEARPIDPDANAIVSPVDGVISQFGKISGGRLLQAKGHYFTATELLGGNATLGERFEHGDFITLYLSPRDYHRIHMPIDGILQTMTYVPGDLFSVNPATTREVENLFARNERVVQIFETAIGKVAVVMVGAIFVGSMETVWAGEITPSADRQGFTSDYTGSNRISLEKGIEMGRFNMGSTVVLLFEPDRIRWESFIAAEQVVTLGRKIAIAGPG